MRIVVATCSVDYAGRLSAHLPVATRLRTYAIALSPAAQSYCDTLFADAAFREWEARALAEPAKPFSRARTDSLYAD